MTSDPSLRLCQAFRIRGLEASSRVVFGPHETNLGEERRFSQRHVAYYRRRAAGGAGIIVTEEAAVNPSDWPYERSPLASLCERGWRQIARAVHSEGALAIAALGHSGGQGSSAYSQTALLAPSRVPEVVSREIPKAMESRDIESTINSFARSAISAITAGMDGVEINAGQYSLVRQFLSGLTNHRGDAYGSNRLLFLKEILQAIRSRTPNAILGLRLCIDELAPWAGITPEIAVEYILGLANSIDYITLVRGSIYSAWATRPDSHVEPGFNLPATRMIKEALKAHDLSVTLIAQGSLVDPRQAEDAIADGVVDAVEMTRAQIAEPDLVSLLRLHGLRARYRPCILCNQNCQVRDPRNPVIGCIGNPEAGYEGADELPGNFLDTKPLSKVFDDQPENEDSSREPTGTERSDRAGFRESRSSPPVIVIGGGPAGLECARTAATRGFHVQLYERSHRLGGALRFISNADGKQRFSLLADWLEGECMSLGVEVILGVEATPEHLSAPSRAVVICTGSRPGRLTFPISADGVVIDPAEALNNIGSIGVPDGSHLVAWDPLGGYLVLPLVETLARRGYELTVVTPDLIVGTQLSRTGDLVPLQSRLAHLDVRMLKHHRIREVSADEVVVEDIFTNRRSSISAAGIINGGPRLPDTDLWNATNRSYDRIGDALAPRSIAEAIYEGRRKALELPLSISTIGSTVSSGS
ncbi:MAG: NAD(P)-binding protein [Actinobacteria bacterium]|nr:NAD(P)-binding protein [Actinomycetota bacterium]MCL6095965.1 NAD(P)-binding protein [Actinomycetota bacterium]